MLVWVEERVCRRSASESTTAIVAFACLLSARQNEGGRGKRLMPAIFGENFYACRKRIWAPTETTHTHNIKNIMPFVRAGLNSLVYVWVHVCLPSALPPFFP